MPKHNTTLNALLADVESQRAAANRAWTGRYGEAEHSRHLVAQFVAQFGVQPSTLLSTQSGTQISARSEAYRSTPLDVRPHAELDPLAHGVAAAALAFHAAQNVDVAAARHHLATAFGQAALARDDATTARCHVLLARCYAVEDQLDDALDCLARGKQHLEQLEPADRVELLCDEAGIQRRCGNMADAYLRLTQAASEVERCQETWPGAMVAIGLSSLFIRSHEFDGAINLLRRVELDAAPFVHAWSANLIAAAMRVGDHSAARTAALGLVRAAPKHPIAGVALAWAVAALVGAPEGVAAAHDASAIDTLLSRSRNMAAAASQCASAKAYAAFAHALAFPDDGEAQLASTIWLEKPPQAFPTELLARMLRLKVAKTDGATRDSWVRRLAAHEASRHAATPLAGLFAPLRRLVRPKLLSADEVAVANAAARGLTMQDTATRLGVPLSRVKRLLHSARKAYGVNNTQELVAQALAAGELSVRG